MKWCLISVLVFCISCTIQTESVKDQLESIDNWELIEYEIHEFDTNGVLNSIPEPKLFARMRYSNDSICLTPQFYFYPIELKDYVIDKLNRYLILRSTLTPPIPIYYTLEYLIIAWEFIPYGNFPC